MSSNLHNKRTLLPQNVQEESCLQEQPDVAAQVP